MDKIEILSTRLLRDEPALASEFKQVAAELGLGLGWHYLLDLIWIAKEIGHASECPRVMDAGAGVGVMQWWLAGQGVDVISVDRMSRRYLPVRIRASYMVKGMRHQDLASTPKLIIHDLLPPRSPGRWYRYPQKLNDSLRIWLWKTHASIDKGTVFIYNQNLTCMPDLLDDSMDAIVSISSLEHNSPDELRACVAELMRVLKPGGKLIATLAATKGQDWLHEPSQGWCYGEATLRDVFALPDDCSSNYDHYDELFEALRNCSELRDNLADFYFKSSRNGMPLGVWDPKYQPVGIVKVKPV